MNPAILDRVNSAAERLGWHEHLDDAMLQRAVSRALETKRLQDRSRATERSILDDDPDEVRRWLRNLPIEPDEQVMVLWPALRSGILATYRGFTNAYDDLWFPGRDDLWVQPPSGHWLLEIDHEEVVRFFVRALRIE